jgi:anti-sigma factor RsiW
MSEPLHPHETLHEAADGRLDPSAQAALDQHLAACAACRAELETIRWTKAQAAAARTGEVPPGFEALLQDVLASGTEPAAGGAVEPAGGPARQADLRWRWVAAAGIAAALVLTIWVLPRLLSSDVPALVAADYEALRTGELTLGIETGEVAAIESWFRREGIRFDTRVFDLGMMRYAAVGGRVHELAGRPSALFVYRGPDGQALVCQMYEGRTGDLPPPSRRLSHDGIDFLVFERNGLTLVFWQEGAVVCVLTGEGDAKAVIDLALAKAMKV